MPRFDFLSSPLPGLTVVQRKSIADHRGFLSRFYCADEFHAAGIGRGIKQINHTLTLNKGVVRGLHFQYPPYAEAKMVSCLQGTIFDVAVDLRHGSPTFLQWHGVELSAENMRSLFIPEGFAHGFQTLSNDCELIYLHSEAYRPDSEGALNALDPRLGISWPLDITEMSDRDRNHILIEQDFHGVML